MAFPRSSSANGHQFHGHPASTAPPYLDGFYNGIDFVGQISQPPSDPSFLPTTDASQHLHCAASTPTSRTMSAYNGSNGDSQHPEDSSPPPYVLQQNGNASLQTPYYSHSNVHTPGVNQSHYMHPTSNASTNHSLSPASASVHNRASPSSGTVVEVIEEYGRISKHTTPSFDDDLLGEDVDLSPSMDTEEFQQLNPGTDMRPFQTEDLMSDSSLSRHIENSSTGSASSPFLSGQMNARTSGSPSRDESYRHLSISAVPLIGTSSPNRDIPRAALQIPTAEPPYNSHSNASGGADGLGQSMAEASTPTHLRSPVVKVEHVTGEDSPPGEPFLGRGLGKRSRPMDTSHLSPRHDESESSEDDMADDPDRSNSSPAQGFPAVRGPDGSWLPSAQTGQAGLGPEMREPIKDTLIPNLKEQEMDRQIAERNAEVADWLQRSHSADRVSGAPPSPGGGVLRGRKSGRLRARSMGDVPGFRPGLLDAGVGAYTGDRAGIPGPGILVNEDSEAGEGYSSELGGDEDSSMLDTSPPASVHAGDALEETQRELSLATLIDPEEEPLPHQFCRARPWRDTPPSKTAGLSNSRRQPANSNQAMMLFNQVADNYDTASRVATWGTRRRLSEADADQVSVPSLLKRISFGKDKDKDKKRGDQRGNFLDMADVKKLIPRRSGSNSKRRAADKDQPFKKIDYTDSVGTGVGSTLAPPSRAPSFGSRPKLNTGGAVAAMAGQIAAIGGGAGSVSATALTSPGPWAQAKQFVKRSRSRSDSGRKSSLSVLMTQHGGPPMLALASPTAVRAEKAKMSGTGDNEDEDDDEGEEELTDDKGITMDLKIRHDPIIPTFQGFQAHVRQLNPRLSQALVDRISHEQVRRYKKLVDFRVKHSNTVRNHKCSSTTFCFALGGEAKILPPKPSGRDPEAAFAGFQISASHSEEESGFGEGAVAAAQFPQGVPLPPVKRLPAEFECPLCFKVKKFQKPSDWTKHVHEDVQPFTCTFHNCSEPKSFKRKADWVRHENERHRQLEWWTCNLPDCSHTCYRKDNFVQHLVREHKRPEPKVKATKAALKATAAGKGRNNISPGGSNGRWQTANEVTDADPHQEEIDKVWQLVEDCHHDTTKQPREEPCRFCGNICNSWKKLTVHLARHMEQISLPVLALVDQKNVTTGPVVSSIEQHEPVRVTIPTHPHSWGGTPIAMPCAMRDSVSPVGLPDQPYPHLEQRQSPYYASNNGAPGLNYVGQEPQYGGQSPVPDQTSPYADHANNIFTAVFQSEQFSPSDGTGTYTDLSPSYGRYETITAQSLGLPASGYPSPNTSYVEQPIYPSTMEQVTSYTSMTSEMQGSGASTNFSTGMGGISFALRDSAPSPTYMQQQQARNYYEHQ
ncbi:MAG: hypothetical protein M1839_005439 [Geoglossum umbratile]|nr:MAG: hypothetical protein M1839_005439 [Geoglossum umbratile]